MSSSEQMTTCGFLQSLIQDAVGFSHFATQLHSRSVAAPFAGLPQNSFPREEPCLGFEEGNARQDSTMDRIPSDSFMQQTISGTESVWPTIPEAAQPGAEKAVESMHAGVPPYSLRPFPGSFESQTDAPGISMIASIADQGSSTHGGTVQHPHSNLENAQVDASIPGTAKPTPVDIFELFLPADLATGTDSGIILPQHQVGSLPMGVVGSSRRPAEESEKHEPSQEPSDIFESTEVTVPGFSPRLPMPLGPTEASISNAILTALEEGQTVPLSDPLSVSHTQCSNPEGISAQQTSTSTMAVPDSLSARLLVVHPSDTKSADKTVTDSIKSIKGTESSRPEAGTIAFQREIAALAAHKILQPPSKNSDSRSQAAELVPRVAAPSHFVRDASTQRAVSSRVMDDHVKYLERIVRDLTAQPQTQTQTKSDASGQVTIANPQTTPPVIIVRPTNAPSGNTRAYWERRYLGRTSFRVRR